MFKMKRRKGVKNEKAAKSLHEIRKINSESTDIVYKIMIYVFGEETKPIVTKPLLPQDFVRGSCAFIL